MGGGPLCFKQGAFRVSSRDVLLGVIEETPFYVGASQCEYLRNTGLLLDVRFLTRSAERPENGSVPSCHARSKF